MDIILSHCLGVIYYAAIESEYAMASKYWVLSSPVTILSTLY